MTAGVRVRFAPSPTGYLHVGGARTALFNWLFARNQNGTLILRIEDTDAERSSEAMSQVILDGLRWLGLDWDEGPYYQSQRLDLYRAKALLLLETGWAYWCLCQPGAHDRACRERNLQQGEGALRFRVPQGPVQFQDIVIGEITVESDTIEDFVLLRSGGQPTYHLSVVVDDIDMRISHVIRGTDHISNTPKQVLLYRAFGFAVPRFAHAPLILGPDKTKLSKRHGETSVTAYRDQGILPEALRNFLVLLGWSPGTDQEIFELNELVQAFSLKGISKANAVFNPEKLAWFNAQYLARLPHEVLLRYLKPEYEKAGLWRDSFETTESGWFRRLVDLLRPRSRTLLDFPPQSRIYIQDEIEYDPAAVAKALGDPALRTHLLTLADRLEALAEYTPATTEPVVRGLAAEAGVKPGTLMNAARVCLTGQTTSPGLFDVMDLVGRRRTVDRLRRAERLS